MRLLYYNNEGEFSLTQFFHDIPRYAILSHTWGLEEITFKDIMEGNGASKTGFNKIQFCGEQASCDGLQYFWVDTCCIDKSSSAELTEAINSMFRWYRESTKCYAYLSDVSRPAVNSDDLAWEAAFRISKWFTRGWTLQELIAPTSVEFFSKEGERLGDKSTLEGHICEIARLPAKALRGSPLSDFSITSRISWAEQRKTTREEDQAYSLLGIFDVFMPLIYGEGKTNAFKRLYVEISKPLIELDHLSSPADLPFGLCKNVPQSEHCPGKIIRFGSHGGHEAGSEIRCLRCDNQYRLNECYASRETVKEARNRSIITRIPCANCESEDHSASSCPWEGFL